ncbi:MAG: Uncharacterised protein [Flavobacterium sp. SCGC AAA160-P02]|nr:MAG: Uncharacterised protein [Flavobacterium sp. SCGC AAA160-P02]
MKNLFALLIITALFASCEQNAKPQTDTNPMSGYILGNDMHTQAAEKFMKAYTENDMESAKDIFSEDAVFSVNDTEMSVDDMMAGFSSGHQYFDNISHNNVDTATMYYNDGSIYTNVWYDWSGNIKATGETLEARGYAWFKWENGKVVEAYNAFDPTAYNAVMNSESSE